MVKSHSAMRLEPQGALFWNLIGATARKPQGLLIWNPLVSQQLQEILLFLRCILLDSLQICSFCLLDDIYFCFFKCHYKADKQNSNYLLFSVLIWNQVSIPISSTSYIKLSSWLVRGVLWDSCGFVHFCGIISNLHRIRVGRLLQKTWVLLLRCLLVWE